MNRLPIVRLKTIDELARFREHIERKIDPNRPVIRVCMTGCRAFGAQEAFDALESAIADKGLGDRIELRPTGCHGFCAKAPVLAIDPYDIFYQHVAPEDASDIIEKTALNGEPLERLLYRHPHTGEPIAHSKDIPFYKLQTRRVLENCGHIDPRSILQYIAHDGYAALARVLSSMSSDQVIDEVERSGLKGRGGAGFPTGRKWRFARSAQSDVKYLICNADEGDPGAFMDRAVLEGDPHRVLEGMLIAAYAIGASKGFIYVRAEYPIAVEHLGVALDQARKAGLLGENILGSGFSFEVWIKEGAGAFVCGEETALIASIEGKRGMPRPRPPFPAQSGVAGQPTNINNVETLANIRNIILDGAEQFASLGVGESKGTKVFSLAGKVNNTGLVEVPIGITMREVIFDIGGGIPKGRKFKSVQMGGPSGGCVPEKYLDMPIDYDSLQSIGAIMGSGGMVVMDEKTCMVEIARFFLSFTRSESCGKCAPCRLGTRQMLSVLTRITQGKGTLGDLKTLREIGDAVRAAALCGLGQTCPKPVISTLAYFEREYIDHIENKKCAAGICDDLMVSPCQHTCPAGVNAARYIEAIKQGEFAEAAEIVRERNPFPAICGRICTHPCESRCRRGDVDDPVAIRALKRFAADWHFENATEKPEPFPLTRKEKVAVVGGGPTGLTAAFHLRRMGYPVTVFESLGYAGGMLMVAIPEFRLPHDMVRKEVQYIVDRGVELRVNTPINMSYTLEDLRKEGFRAILVAAGAQKSQRIGVPGEDQGFEGIYYGLNFLRDVKLSRQPLVGSRVVVIGGGNVAIDVARSSRRLMEGQGGECEIRMICLESRAEMPAFGDEVQAALDEGIEIHNSLGVRRIIGRGRKTAGVEVVDVTSVFDEQGSFNPSYQDGSEKTLSADTIIFAVGQAPDLSFLPADSNLERTRWERLAVNSNTLATNVKGIFAAGDFVIGPNPVIEAIAAGRRSAAAIDKYLRGDESPVELWDLKPKGLAEEAEEEIAEIPRVQIRTHAVHERLAGFEEIEIRLTPEEARSEASRCLQCDKRK